MKKYYVYTLAKPDGSVFYVGKGSGNRMRQHITEAKSSYPTRTIARTRKCEIIRGILAQGQKVLIEKAYETDVERDAYVYEWALINLIYGRHTLTNHIEGRIESDIRDAKGVTFYTPVALERAVRLAASPFPNSEYIRNVVGLGLRSDSQGKAALDRGEISYISHRENKSFFNVIVPLDILDEIDQVTIDGEKRQTIIEHFLCYDSAFVTALGDQATFITSKLRSAGEITSSHKRN